MIAPFSLFGRGTEVRRLDAALAQAGVDPRGVQEAVKLAALRLLREAPGVEMAAAAELLAYCLLGPEDFAREAPAERVAALEARLAHAPAAPEGVDARLVLLALASRQAHPEIAARFEIEG